MTFIGGKQVDAVSHKALGAGVTAQIAKSDVLHVDSTVVAVREPIEGSGSSMTGGDRFPVPWTLAKWIEKRADE